MGRLIQGVFKPKNPNKYKGDPTKIIYRSGWELKLMVELDRNTSVLQWSSEEIIIPYRDPFNPNKTRRYFPDFYVKKKNHSDGKIVEVIIEVKPAKETVPPVVQNNKKPNKKYLTEVNKWAINSAKWDAAEAFCKKKGYLFEIMTEKELGIKR